VRRRAAFILATVAALHGAPSAVLAAPLHPLVAPSWAPAASAGEPGVGDLLLLLGIVVGVAAVALLGIGWMLAVRGRDDEPEAAHGARAAENEARRARRRTRAAGHDPVLAAMGLEDDHPPGDEAGG